MNDAEQPREPGRLNRFLRQSLLVVGGAVYLFSTAISAMFVSYIWSGAMGLAITATGLFITFRLFCRDDNERKVEAQLKRGFSFACSFLAIVAAVTLTFLFVPDMRPPIGPERAADITMVIAGLAPIAFAIG